MRIAITGDSSLIIVDVQYDFLPGGSLPVPKGDEIIPILNNYIKLFINRNRPIIATRDWHPRNHISFMKRGGRWPEHCVQNTRGAEFPKGLELPTDVIIISKGYMENKDAYSGFQDTNLDDVLKNMNIRRLFIGGLATDYCVRATVLDALKLGYQVVLLLDGVRGVDVTPGDSERAVREMISRGAIAITLDDIMG